MPAIALHIFFKKLEIPSVSEGFESVIKVNFVPKFESDADRDTYNA